jgi:peptidoglycan/LPS O-acetylase OafA/YrhL
LLGKIFGSSEHAPLNIAGSVLLLCVLAMLATPFLPIASNFPVADVLKLFGGIALAALTFLGGYLGGRAKP